MEKGFTLKVSARLQKNCEGVVDVVNNDQLILINKGTNDYKQYQIDEIHFPNDSNEKIFEDIIRVPSNQLFEGYSSMIFCLGGPKSGKTFTVAGKINSSQTLNQPGILTYLMRRLFSKYKYQAPIQESFSFWCRILEIRSDCVINLISDASQRSKTELELSSKEVGYKAELKSFSHFEQFISEAYQQKNNRSHLMIQITLRKEASSEIITNSTITFIEFGSSFYKAQYEKAEQLELENDIESMIHVLQNLYLIKNADDALFKTSLLAQTLKEQVLQCSYFNLIGMLNDVYHSNLKTLNYLDMALQKKQDYTLIMNVKEQIKREQTILNNLYEKHRKALNLLSRCIGMELGNLEKHKKTKNFDGPILNSFNKKCEKIKFANLKKLQNENIIEKIEHDLASEKKQLENIRNEYNKKREKVNQERKIIEAKKQALEEKYNAIINPPIIYTSVPSSHFWKPPHEQVVRQKFPEEDEVYGSLINQSQWGDEYKSNKASSLVIPATYKTIKTSHKLPRASGKYERNEEQHFRNFQQRRLKQLKTEIGQLFTIICEQESILQSAQEKIPPYNNLLINQLKNRKNKVDIDITKVRECLGAFKQNISSAQVYRGIKEDIFRHEQIEKQIINKPGSGSSSLSSGKSLKSLKSQFLD